MFREILGILIFPIYVFLILPVLFVFGIFGHGIVILNHSNASIVAFIDKQIKKIKIVLLKKKPDQKELSLVDSQIFNHLEGLFVYKVSSLSQKEEFKTKIICPNKKQAIEELRKLVEKYGTINGENLSFHQLQALLTKIDLEHKTQLAKHIIQQNGNFPNFIRTDIELWEGLYEIYFEVIVDQQGLDFFIQNLETRPDLPGYQTTIKQKSFEREYLSKMLLDECFDQSILFYLWQYSKIDREENSNIVAKKFGDWIYLTAPETRHFLRLAIYASKNIHNVNNIDDLDFSIRHILYGLIQAADAELMQRVSIAFKNSLSTMNITNLDDHSEFGKFLSGSFPPTIAGVAKFLDHLRKSNIENQNIIQTEFLNFVKNTDYLSIENLTDNRFIQKLYLMGRLRGSIMHPGKFNIDDCANIITYLIKGELPGEFFYKIGIDIGY